MVGGLAVMSRPAVVAGLVVMSRPAVVSRLAVMSKLVVVSRLALRWAAKRPHWILSEAVGGTSPLTAPTLV